MFDVFSTREIADGIWIIGFIIFVILWKQTRKQSLSLIKAALARKIVMMFLFVCFYFCLITLLFTKLSFWKFIYLKDIIIWVLLSAIPTCFSRITKPFKVEDLKQIIIENITLTAIVEYIISSFTFDLWIELVMVPIIAFFALLKVISDSKEEFKKVSKLLNAILVIVGVFIIGGTIYVAVRDYLEINVIDSIVSFVIPLAYSNFLIPTIYVCIIYTKYDTLFSRIYYMDTDQSRKKHRFKILKACKLSYKKISKAETILPRDMYQNMKESDFKKAICKIK